MSIERVGQGLKKIAEILQRPTLDPDPARQDWAPYREGLEQVLALADASSAR